MIRGWRMYRMQRQEMERFTVSVCSDEGDGMAATDGQRHTDSFISHRPHYVIKDDASVVETRFICCRKPSVIWLRLRHPGVMWAAVSVVCSTLTSLFIKLLAGKVSADEIVFFRVLLPVFFASICVAYHRTSLRFSPKISMFLVLRAIAGTSIAALSYSAYQAIPVGTAKALICSTPLFTGVFACLLLKEHYSAWTASLSASTVIGVVLVSKPSFIFGGGQDDRASVLGLLFALSCAFMSGANTILLRSLQMLRVDLQAVIFTHGIIAVVFSAVLITALGDWTIPACGRDRWLLVGICLLGFFEQLSMSLALRMEKAMVVSIIRTNDVLLAFIFDFLVFGIVPSLWTAVGATGVITSAIGMTITAHFTSNKGIGDGYL